MSSKTRCVRGYFVFVACAGAGAAKGFGGTATPRSAGAAALTRTLGFAVLVGFAATATGGSGTSSAMAGAAAAGTGTGTGESSAGGGARAAAFTGALAALAPGSSEVPTTMMPAVARTTQTPTRTRHTRAPRLSCCRGLAVRPLTSENAPCEPERRLGALSLA